LLQAGIGAGALAGLGSLIALSRPQPTADWTRLIPQFKAVRDTLLTKAQALLDLKLLARDDGYIFTVDVAQLMIVFAQANDLAGYTAMREHAVKNLIIDRLSDPITRGFVAWRSKPGEKPDASGTTEALRLARGLWLGAKAFNRPADADLSLFILDGYARHATADQGIWLIRNYFNFATRSFASNSFLVDYDPDFIREVADAKKNATLSKLADDSLALVCRAVAPSGLLYDMIQPEVATLYPELNLSAFSPNDVIQFSNCCTVAATVCNGSPEIPRRLLAFAMNRLADLRAYYVGRTGEPYSEKAASISDFSILARLSAGLGADRAASSIADHAMRDWNWCAQRLDCRQVFTLTEILQAMHALLRVAVLSL
jgi:hypothetical protein